MTTRITLALAVLCLSASAQLPTGGGSASGGGGTSNKTCTFALSATSCVITHNLGTTTIDPAIVSCKTGTTTVTPLAVSNISSITTTQLTVNFSAAPAAGSCALNLSGINGANGTGDFNGPASSVSGNIVSFNGTTGKTGQDSGIAVASVSTHIAGDLTQHASTTSAQLASVLSDKTGTGVAVFATSPTLVTPNLGTPSAATLTNATGLPVSTGVSGLGTGVATALGAPSSANIAAAVTDETGTGSLVFNNSPSLTTPNLGTPSAATLTNATGLPIATGVSGLGAGVATALATPSSANIATAVTDETGTGSLVFGTSPTLTGPIFTSSTIAGLPSAAASNGRIYVVTDASVAGSCTSGSGTALAWCRSNGTSWVPVGDGGTGGGGTGTVTAVGLSLPSWLTVTGSPVTSSGTLAVSATGGLTNNQVLGTGGAGTVALRSLAAADIPTALSNTTSVNGTTIPSSATLATTTGAQTIQNKTIDNTNVAALKANSFTVQDSTDATAQVRFNVAGVATGTTQTLSVPNASGTIALTSSNVATATALASNGTNCSAGQAAAGVDASGNAEGCFTPSGSGSLADPGSNGIIKRTALNTTAPAVSGTDYAPATSGSSILKGNGAGGFASATPGTDYQAAIASGDCPSGQHIAGITAATGAKNCTPDSGGGGGASAGPAATVNSGALAVACGAACYVNGFNLNNFSGGASGFAGNTTDYVWAQSGAVKIGYATTAPTTLTNITGVAGITAMPSGPDIYPIAVCSISSGTLSTCADVRNVGVGQPDKINFNPSTFVTTRTGTVVDVTAINGGVQGFGVRVVFTGAGTYDYTVPFTTQTVAPIASCGSYAGSSSYSASFPSTGVLRITATGAGTSECTVIGALAYAYQPGQDFLLAISPTSASANSSLQATTTATISAGNQSGWTADTTFTCKAPCTGGSLSFGGGSTLTGTGTKTITATLSAAIPRTFTIAATAADGTERTVNFPVSITYAPLYSYVRTLTFPQQTANLTAFPVLVDITDATLKSVANGGHVQSASGYDIVFATDSAGANGISNVEIEAYDPVAGRWRGWVPVNLSSSSTAAIYMFYGWSGATTSQYSGSPFDSGYKLVAHMKDGTTLSGADSSLSSLSGTVTGATAAAGQIDGAASFSGAGRINYGNSIDLSGGSSTVSAWIKPSSIPSTDMAIISKGYNGTDTPWALSIKATTGVPGYAAFVGGSGYGANGTSAVSTTAWTHVAGTYNSSTSTWTMYVNGASAGTGTGVGPSNTAQNVFVGDLEVNFQAPPFNPFAGLIDEARVSNVARSAAWIAAEYTNQNAPVSFVTVGSEGAAH